MGKIVILMRHAQAEFKEIADETVMVLTPTGREIQKKMAELLKAEGLHPDKIFTSPLIRAKESGLIVGKVFHHPIIADARLEEASDDDGLIRIIEEANDEDILLFIGHEPTLIDFGRRLCGENILPQGLPKSGCAVLAFSEEVGLGKARLKKFIHPGVLPL